MLTGILQCRFTNVKLEQLLLSNGTTICVHKEKKNGTKIYFLSMTIAVLAAEFLLA